MLEHYSPTDGADLGFAPPLINVTALEADKEIVNTIITFTDMDINKNDILLTILRTIGEAMEAGRSTLAPGQFTVGIRGVAFFLNTIPDSPSVIPLRHGHVIEAARQIVSQMVEQRKSTGMILRVTVNGLDIAEGWVGLDR